MKVKKSKEDQFWDRIKEPKRNRNYIINGGFDTWQRGTSFVSDNVHNAGAWDTKGRKNP